ncbi:MAG: crotonase/enoyl-CoA hydratase family protein [Rhizobiaceae bacterium]
MNLESTFFKTELTGGVAHFRMAKPGKANAMSSDFWEDLPRMVRELEANPSIRVLVISGEGKHFTAGMDLSAFQPIMEISKAEPARGAFALRELILRLQDTFTALEQVRFPVVAAIHGACLGGGIDFISACDFRIASKDAYFGIEEIHIGMTADVGTLQRLPKLIAPGIVRELAYTGRRFSAEEAHQWGLVNSTHKDHKAVVAAALETAEEIAAKSPLAIAGIKNALNFARDHSVADGLEQIATWNSGMLRSEDLSSALQAKINKKQAVFSALLSKAGL